MESDDDYESFSFPNNSPTPSPKHHRRLKRLKKSTVDLDQSTKSVSELIGLPRIDFAKLEALESKSSKIRGNSFDDNNNIDSNEAFSESWSNEGLFGDDKVASVDQKESKKSLEFDDSFDNENNNNDNDDDDDNSNRKEKELTSCFDDLDSEQNDTNRDLESGLADVSVRKETKRALEFDDEIGEDGLDQRVEIEGDDINLEIREGNEEKKKVTKKKRSKRSSEDSKVENLVSNKKREAKERKAHLEQLHAESQRLLRETRGVSFKAVPLVQKPISSILERIRKRKLEVSKKFSQSNSYDLVKEGDGCLKEDVIDHPKNVETEVAELSDSVEKEKVSSVSNGDSESNETHVFGEKTINEKVSSDMPLDEDSTPIFRAPVDDTQELFGDAQTSDGKESEDDLCEQTISSQEEEMEPSLLTMKLKFDSVPDDISDEEDNDKENVEPDVQEHSSPTGDPVKAFIDEEAEEEDDSDNERMRFGDDDEDGDDDDIEELNKMIATGYKERPVDLETRNELHQKWLEEKDAAGTDDLLRRLNVTSKLRDASLLDEEDEEAEEDDEMSDDVEEEVERPRVARFDSKKAKELIAQMFTDKDDAYISSDDEEETEKIIVRERVRNKAEEKGKLISPVDDEDSREVFGLIKKLNTVPDVRKKANITSFFDTMLTGGNRNSSSKSSFLSRASTHSVPTSTKQKGSSAVRAFIFGRDDSNSRSSISVLEDSSDATATSDIQSKKVTTKYSSSQLQARSSTQTTQLVAESRSTTSLFEILKQSSMPSNVENQTHKVELSKSIFAAFKIPKKPIKIQARV